MFNVLPIQCLEKAPLSTIHKRTNQAVLGKKINGLFGWMSPVKKTMVQFWNLDRNVQCCHHPLVWGWQVDICPWEGAPTVSDLKMVDQCQAKIGPTSTYISRGADSNHNTVQNTMVTFPSLLLHTIHCAFGQGLVFKTTEVLSLIKCFVFLQIM